jgi:hypothetical protein
MKTSDDGATVDTAVVRRGFGEDVFALWLKTSRWCEYF